MYQKIFCPIDGSETSGRGITEAIQLARDQHAQLCFLHIVDNGALIMYSPMTDEAFAVMRQRGREILTDALASAHAQGIEAEQQLVEIMTGRAGPVIVEQAEKYGADLIVMGTHGRRGISRLLMGSDAATVIGTCRVPILLVK